MDVVSSSGSYKNNNAPKKLTDNIIIKILIDVAIFLVVAWITYIIISHLQGNNNKSKSINIGDNQFNNGFINEIGDLSNFAKEKNSENKKITVEDEIYLGGMDELIDKIIHDLLHTRQLPKKLIKKMKIKHPRGILLYGPPGCGKTALATLIARRITNNYKIIRGPEILNEFVGGSERGVRRIFSDAYKNVGNGQIYVTILDEFDSLVHHRGNDMSGNRDSVTNQFLAMLQGPDTPDNFIIIATTNRKDLIDPAIIRPGRIGLHYEIPLPNVETRKKIFELYLEPLIEENIISEVDYSVLAKKTEGLSGAEISQISQSIISKWGLTQVLVTQQELMEIIEGVMSEKKIDKKLTIEEIFDENNFETNNSAVTEPIGRSENGGGKRKRRDKKDINEIMKMAKAFVEQQSI